jgi:hypothetical protein
MNKDVLQMLAEQIKKAFECREEALELEESGPLRRSVGIGLYDDEAIEALLDESYENATSAIHTLKRIDRIMEESDLLGESYEDFSEMLNQAISRLEDLL